MIYLLDLNYTLVANSEQIKKPFCKQIENEVYRHDLIEKIKDDKVILVTARPKYYQPHTIKSIQEKTDLPLANVYFNEGFPPPQWKEKALLKYIFPLYGNDTKQYMAIESNPKTRNMYMKHGIVSMTYKEFMEEMP